MSALADDTPLRIQSRVIGALILRDMRTRFAGAQNYVIAVLWPLTHLCIMAALPILTGKTPPLGDSSILFVATGLVPYITLLYASRFTVLAGLQNAPLLYFPAVKLLDIFLARMILEFITSFMVASVVIIVMVILGIDVVPPYLGSVICGYLGLIGFTAGLGVLNGVIALLFPVWQTCFILIAILLYFTSGILFVAENLPEGIRSLIVWNPLLQYVEWIRSGYYEGYGEVTLSIPYAITCAVIMLSFSLLSERLWRGRQA